jgi:hypothetical protein
MAKKRKIKRAIDETVEVDNPLYLEKDQMGRSAGPRRIRVQRALRNDPLAKLHATGRLNDVELRVGRRVQSLMEASEVGGIRTMDPTNEPVDGGGKIREPINDRQLRAMKYLNGTLYPLLGKLGKALVSAVLAGGMMPEDYARSTGIGDARGINSIGREFQRYLGMLAGELGYTNAEAAM